MTKILSSETQKFLHDCAEVLDSIKEDILKEVEEYEDSTPFPKSYYIYGRMSINSELWPRLGKVMRLVKDNDYHSATAEFELHARVTEAIRLMVYRLTHTPATDMLLQDPISESMSNPTLTTIPAMLHIKVSEVATLKGPLTKNLADEMQKLQQKDDMATIGAAIDARSALGQMEALANGTGGDSNETLPMPPVATPTVTSSKKKAHTPERKE